MTALICSREALLNLSVLRHKCLITHKQAFVCYSYKHQIMCDCTGRRWYGLEFKKKRKADSFMWMPVNTDKSAFKLWTWWIFEAKKALSSSIRAYKIIYYNLRLSVEDYSQGLPSEDWLQSKVTRWSWFWFKVMMWARQLLLDHSVRFFFRGLFLLPDWPASSVCPSAPLFPLSTASLLALPRPHDPETTALYKQVTRRAELLHSRWIQFSIAGNKITLMAKFNEYDPIISKRQSVKVVIKVFQ